MADTATQQNAALAEEAAAAAESFRREARQLVDAVGRSRPTAATTAGAWSRW
jgi:methyl-accepting chemotaxis protein